MVPYYFVHLADLINALVTTTKEQGNIILKMNTKVVEYDFTTPSVKTSWGDWISDELIICADGIKSAVPDTINASRMEPFDTGNVAYRILAPAAPLLKDPETRHLVTELWAVARGFRAVGSMGASEWEGCSLGRFLPSNDVVYR
jgi:salicylate hydroxylase